MPPRRKKTKTPPRADTYRHDEASRKNIPEAGLVDFEPASKPQATDYCWDPRESPQLIWAGKAGMNKVEVEEQASFEVPLVNLHIHERISTQGILRAAQRQDVQRSLFADPEMEFQEEIKFYQHDVDWTNRMVLGDSLLVMNSLNEREQMRGKVQCIYMDPPYGIKFGSNFQPRIDQRDVKDGRDDDLTREVMQVQAFRDTWELGVSSYLSYLRDRLLVARELLADTGSIFVQIGDENVHRVRCLMDEVFGEENFVAELLVKKKGSQMGGYIDPVNDYLLWYGRSGRASGQVKYRQLHEARALDQDTIDEFRLIELSGGETVTWDAVPSSSGQADLRLRPSLLRETHPGARPYRLNPFTSGYERTNQSLPYTFRGKTYSPGRGKCWKTTVRCEDGSTPGIVRLDIAGRLIGEQTLSFKRYLEDFGHKAISNWWDALGGASRPSYVVQTNEEVVKRCILMTTDPGDLVLDPTCGSGTTAFVAEQWGRRWITCDTSRVALAIARHRLLTGAFDYYRLRHPESGVAGGFVYKSVPHITLKSIAQNTEIDEIAARFQPEIGKALQAVNHAFGEEWQEWEVPRGMPKGEQGRENLPGGDVQTRIRALNEFWRLKREMQAAIDESIQRNAPQEELVDQPETVRGVVRVSGPFTMESIPDTGEISAEVETSVIPGDEEEAAGDGERPDVEVSVFTASRARQAANAAAYVSNMIETLRKTGVDVRGVRKIQFSELRRVDHAVVHAEGSFSFDGDGNGRQHADEKALAGQTVHCAVVFGPQNGAVSEVHVRDAVRAAAPYDAVLFCGYDFTAPAQDVINSDPIPGKRLLMAYISPDTAMGDLLKDTKASQVFTMVGEPDLVIYRKDDPDLPALLEQAAGREQADVAKRAERLQEGELFIELRGVDLYDPVKGEVTSDKGANVHALFIDQDYDGKSFCISQAMFPNRKDMWDKIARNLKGTIDEEAFEAMRTLVSLPFKPGREGQVQIKVIDTRGNAVVKTVRV